MDNNSHSTARRTTDLSGVLDLSRLEGGREGGREAEGCLPASSHALGALQPGAGFAGERVKHEQTGAGGQARALSGASHVCRVVE